MAITNETICRIEGHGAIELDLEKNTAKLRILEGERLFEGILFGRDAAQAHWITPRICGVCPIVHNLTTILAAEDVFGVEVSEQARLLRRVLMAAQIIESHILHLFFLSLPDYLGLNRGTDLAYKRPDLFAAALELKKVSDEIAEKIGGRPIHPVTTKVGGFHQYPKKEILEELIGQIEKAKKSAKLCLEICLNQKYPELEGSQHFLVSYDNNLDYTPSNGQKIEDEEGSSFLKSDYRKQIIEVVTKGSTAKFGQYRDKGLMVGALARINIQKEYLNPILNKIPYGKYLRTNPTLLKLRRASNPFHNNIAQGVEVVHFLDEAGEVLGKLLNNYNPAQKDPDPVAKKGRGIGVLEAPRGTLYYELHFDAKGLVEFCNIVTPTVQNLTSIQDNANLILQQHKDQTPEKKKHLIEMLIRSYDPCITCSVH